MQQRGGPDSELTCYLFLTPTIYFLRMHRVHTLTVLATFLIGCAQPAPQGAAPQPAEHALSGLAAQHIAVLPTYMRARRAQPEWSIGRPTELQRTLDADIIAAFDDRGLRHFWVFPEELVKSYKSQPDVRHGSVCLGRGAAAIAGAGLDARLPEPLASQIRTLVAFQQDLRLVLAPVELRLEPVKPKGGRGVLRVVLDARLSNIAGSATPRQLERSAGFGEHRERHVGVRS